jgi:hypothetical protein
MCIDVASLMSDDLLQQVQSLQFTDKVSAENLLLDLIRELFPLDVKQVELRPLAVSLNSFNGFMTLTDGQRLFFKTHTEPDSVIGEYYHSATLSDAGYPVIKPLYSSTEWGKQLLIYEVIDDPSVFDVSWAIENRKSDDLDALTRAQQAADDHLFTLYQQTLAMQSADEASEAGVHQLFYHRLTGGRLERFYGPLPGRSGSDVIIHLPQGDYLMSELRQVQWEINGQHYHDTLDDLIDRAVGLLQPRQAGPSIIGHGDAHNGNVFFRAADGGYELIYFDPAFAGRHHPLLDLTKPLFHNVFAMWMYFPQEKATQLEISMSADNHRWHVDYDYTLHPVREMFLSSKVERVLIATLVELKHRGWLRDDWRAYLKAALFCCPLLTMNLADRKKFPPAISLLGLAMAIEMGAESRGERSSIDQLFDDVEAKL